MHINISTIVIAILSVAVMLAFWFFPRILH
jgi:hypothetical protein